MLALTLEAAKNSAILIIVALVIVALVVARFVASVAFTAVTLLIVGALALGVWTQRQSLQRCADEVRVSTATAVEATCTFFGSQITIPATSSLPSQPAG